MAAVAQIEVPPAARALCALARVDYGDAFVVDVGPTRELTTEQWVRRVADAAPDKLRGTPRSGWTSMGIQLDEAPPERTVLGWEIRRSTPDYVARSAPLAASR